MAGTSYGQCRICGETMQVVGVHFNYKSDIFDQCPACKTQGKVMSTRQRQTKEAVIKEVEKPYVESMNEFLKEMRADLLAKGIAL